MIQNNANKKTSEPEFLTRQEGAVARHTLNRPSALNALTLEMIRMLTVELRRIEKDPETGAAFIQGAGERAFCAGGDIKAAYLVGMSCRRSGGNDWRPVSLFFGEEYSMNRQLYHFQKPLLAFMNGITMGGGFGVAGPCMFRIACEKTVFAMPETGIGFFPDIGSALYLNHCPGRAGRYLALTGGTIGPADMLWCGLATHYVPMARWTELQAEVAKVALKGKKAIADVLAGFHETPAEQGPLEQNAAVADKCFAGDTVEEILEALKGHSSEWAKQTASVIATRAPVSLKVALARLDEAKGKDFDRIIATDFTLAQRFMMNHDFYEGVRAAVIDKDRDPKWSPDRLPEVDEATVRSYFMNTGYNLDDVHP
jgi:enoyl-CoA hydratase